MHAHPPSSDKTFFLQLSAYRIILKYVIQGFPKNQDDISEAFDTHFDHRLQHFKIIKERRTELIQLAKDVLQLVINGDNSIVLHTFQKTVPEKLNPPLF